MAAAKLHDDAKAVYCQQYFEALDLAISSIKSSFDQPGYKTFSQVEQLLLKSYVGSSLDGELKAFCEFFESDFDQTALVA